MAMGEFDLIKRYFEQPQIQENDSVSLSIGDDCALVSVPDDSWLAITTDTMVEHTHFLPSISPEDLAYKAVATNLSDLASMGAQSKWISLALTLPKVDESWLERFSQSLLQTLKNYNVTLIGGDTTKGTLSVTITAQGIVEKGKALCRHQAKAGDLIYVSGTLGDSAAGLQQILSGKRAVGFDEEFLQQRHFRPTPRIALGQALVDIAHAAIDLSDGLNSDLGHILKRSQCAAEIELSSLPLSSSLLNLYERTQAEQFALSGGEDYELCFTLPPENQTIFEARLKNLDVPCTCIGRVVPAFEKETCGRFSIRFLRDGQPMKYSPNIGFDHFKE
ncbi:thiamine-phosphate kinase [Rodentibacter pneumotropicus]|uniref:Thiamine-monophosphate kinase n=1 Tax=Rodentibacter pneumotropicus TaxID=758 RepID=A0A4S2P745_9PAST|nr:thiamine-phosphate kinase [Rodentibacter pneumotropicus]TGZ98486.1 thiamine-phosphate kinase [Rodentibacter pneumotropicus]THA01241.1 thiamine-phosphate kinase [Rodentibacter pneumotropicus]THA08887.1 thiamine-phosphate kinase [Rodentibacter pneumotropicus]THA14600.1 thiamine-phosphate kinase [Rodentibacter pneumotropicus]